MPPRLNHAITRRYPWIARLSALTAVIVIGRLIYLENSAYSGILILPGVLFLINLLALPTKRAMAWAVVLGPITFIFCGFVLVLAATGFFDERSSTIFAYEYAGLLALAQVALTWGAIKTYYSREGESPEQQNPERKNKDSKILTGAIIGGVILTLLFLITLVLIAVFVRSNVRLNDARARYSLQVLNEALAVYHKDHPGLGYPVGLTALQAYSHYNGHTIDPLLLCNNSSCVKDGFIFTYSAKGPKPPMVGYSLIARPIRYFRTGSRNLYTDESGSVHQITEDRAALPSDPQLLDELRPGEQEPQLEDVD